MTRQEVEETYKISDRIEAEERCLDHAVTVFTSTQQVSAGGIVCAGGVEVGGSILGAGPPPFSRVKKRHQGDG